MTNSIMKSPGKKENLPGHRVVEGEIFSANIQPSGLLGIEIRVTYPEPVVIDAEFHRVSGELPPPARRLMSPEEAEAWSRRLDEMLEDQL